MAKLAKMNQLSMELFLLALMSLSALSGGYFIYLYIQRVRNIRLIKRAIMDVDADDLILNGKKRAVSKSFLDAAQTRMRYANLHFPPLLFLLFVLFFAGLSGFGAALFVGHWGGYILGFPFGVFLFYLWFEGVIARRKKEFNRAFAIAISVLVKMMKTGIGFEQAMAKSIEVSNSKMFKEIFEHFFGQKNTIGEEEAFLNLTKFVDSKELLIFAMAVKIGRASGGRFSNTLQKVEQTLVYRKQTQERIDVVTREGAVGSYIVAGIAIFLYFALDANFDGKLHAYYMDSVVGRFQIFGIFAWIFFGLMVNKMIVRIKE